MRIVFGALSLLVVLAIVGALAKHQWQAPGAHNGVTAGTAAATTPNAGIADASGRTVPQQSRDIQKQFRDDTVRALQQGADRNARAPQ
ncbi:MAG: hypothetical protein M3Y67_05120 [Pseudomonadota bacterium]|nr:hypothetical protein [Pseudomonadota bacterium]